MSEFAFNLGDKVRCKITGFEGIVIGRHQWINNCNTYSVKSQVLKDGMPQESVNFDEPQLELIVEKEVPIINQKTGGPDRKIAPTNSHPSR